MYRTNSFLTAAAFSALLLCTHPLYAEEAAAAEDAAQESDDAESAGPWTLSGSATLASEYMTRGFSDSDSKPACKAASRLSMKAAGQPKSGHRTSITTTAGKQRSR
ncbi:MAG TPA: hypothetical protein PLX33_09435 [Alphaproteobacteria bacterium]|nr:hypothetical protein [Alphaproteobacteria bacterium]